MNLNQITVPSINLEVSVPFYEKLGLTLIVSALPDYARFECPDGDGTFSIHKVEALPSGTGVWVYFEVPELDEKVAELMAKGLLFEALPEDKTWLWREARLKDPDGNQIILFYAGINRKSPPWRLGN
jgi:catechol 2,3-dioxygenase-like lactoylglutathione lyase family enzyme